MSFAGRTYLVTGAARGIGQAIAQALVEASGQVAMVDIDATAGAETAAALGGNAMYIEGDVGLPATAEKAIARAVDRFGRIDGLVNNAGISCNRPVDELSLEDWNRVLSVNLTGTFLFAQAAAPHLAASGHGAIVNMASTRARMSEPGTEAYSASKGGIVALTHALAASLSPAVRVNCISPGWIHTKGPAPAGEDHAQHLAGRVGTPDDIAALALWLLSDAAGFVTGADYVADGGMTRKMIYVE
jgi:NAD(P)-dependent dehydrogenase (short-subunit alcohol dehydrogenase family)